MKAKLTLAFILLCVIAISGYLVLNRYDGSGTQRVSLSRLIKESAKYDNMKIRTKGYLILEFENTALYLSEKDAQEYSPQNALWLEIEVTARPELKGKYAAVEGTFSAAKHGHLGQFSGAITNVTLIE